MAEETHTGIWLEVTEVHYDSSKEADKRACSVSLKGDREHPKPARWPVKDDALKENAYETYKAIFREMDNKRQVLARLSCSKDEPHQLRCDFFRFQSPDQGSR